MSSINKVFVLGASGSVGRLVVREALSRGFEVTAQTRDARSFADSHGAAKVVELNPVDPVALGSALNGQDAVIFAIGVKQLRTTVFSDVTKALLPAMKAAGVNRLIAITGVGAGDTRGHGGFVYDRIIFPLFTRRVYEDKERQEKLIEASGLDWVIVRPASFGTRLGAGPLQAITQIEPGTVLRTITREEVARFVLDQVTSEAFLRTKVFIGHP